MTVRLICIGGVAGSGKTTLSAALMRAIPNSVHLDTDRIRKQFHGVPETTKLPPEVYAYEASKPFFAEMDRRVKEALAGEKCVIVSATFLHPETRERYRKMAEAAGGSFTGIWLEASLDILLSRVAQRVNDASDANADVVRRQAESIPQVNDWFVINAAQLSGDVLKEALRIIGDTGDAAAKNNFPASGIKPK